MDEEDWGDGFDEDDPGDQPLHEEERCRVCIDFGELQCDDHGPAIIASMAAEDEHRAVVDALRTVLAYVSSDSGPGWPELEHHTRVALREMGEEP